MTEILWMPDVTNYLRKISLLTIIFCFLCVYHFSYCYFISPTFNYAGYSYIKRSLEIYVLTYGLTLFPVFFYRFIFNASNYGLSLLYMFCFAPSMLTATFMFPDNISDLILLLFSLSLSMSALFFSSSKSNNEFGAQKDIKSGAIRLFIHSLSTLAFIIVIYDNWSHMALVSFYNVYELRFQARDSAGGAFSGYLTMWLSICFLPYYMTTGILNKNKLRIIVAVIIAVTVYMTNGSKSTLLLPFIILGLYYFIKLSKCYFLLNLMVVMSVVSLFMLSLDNQDYQMTKAIFFMRVLATPGWTLVTYYDYFSHNFFTYYTHVSFINSLTGAYPYGDHSLGQMIGYKYSNSYDANFNANFWSTDGLAALGILGILPATVMMMVIVLLIDKASKYYNSIFVSLWFTGFWMTLLNAPLSTSLLSGGGLIIMFALYLSRLIISRKQQAVD